MQTQTFPCPFCGKKMGVGSERFGKKVRCPHCSRVLVVPAPATAAEPLPAVVPLPVPEPPPDDIPSFNLPSQEARESIFGDHEPESDDVFSSSDGNKVQMPDVPPPEPVLPTPGAANNPELDREPANEMNSPFSGTASPALQPIPVVVPIPTVAPALSGTNPWAEMDQLVAQPAQEMLPVVVSLPESPLSEPEEPKPRKNRMQEEVEDRPTRRTRPPATAGGNPLFKIGFFILAPYALLITLLAVYGLFFKSSVPSGHPLSTIPDNFGEFAPAERKKTGKLAFPVDGELPPELRVALGGKLEIGQLEIEPLGLEQRLLKIATEGKSEKRIQTSTAPAIVLRLKIRNASDDLLIHPLDPAFNRRIVGTERVGTGLTVGKQTFWGGAIGWPFSGTAIRVYETAQEADGTPLKPGETREFVVFSNSSASLVKSVKDARDALLWRVQVRRGRIDFDGKDVPVTAIIGVEFKAADVKETE